MVTVSNNGNQWEESASLQLMYGFDGIYYLRDIRYIIRMIRKLAGDVERSRDIDWVQGEIELFLILNSRFHDALMSKFVNNVRKYHTLPKNYGVDRLLRSNDTLSRRYHNARFDNRNAAAHGTNYQHISVPEFDNDVLPRPMNYVQTEELPNTAGRDALTAMWAADMRQCADDLERTLRAVFDELNTFGDLPRIDPFTGKSVIEDEGRCIVPTGAHLTANGKTRL